MNVDLTLPCGFVDSEGNIERRATIRGMTARVKKELGKKSTKSNPAQAQEFVLTSCIVSLGKNEAPTGNQILGLLGGDRDYLLFQIRKETLGSELKGRLSCQSCDEVSGVAIDIEEDFDVFSLPEDKLLTVPDDGTRGFRTFTVEIPEENLNYTFRYETGIDRENASRAMQNNHIEGRMKLMGLCTVKATIRGKDVEGPIGAHEFELLPLAEYETLAAHYDGNAPGLDMNVLLACNNCGNENIWELDPADFFGQSGVVKRSRNVRLTLKSGR